MDAEAFNERLGPCFGEGLSSTALAQLFMKIDADCGGTVDWCVFGPLGPLLWSPNNICALSHIQANRLWLSAVPRSAETHL